MFRTCEFASPPTKKLKTYDGWSPNSIQNWHSPALPQSSQGSTHVHVQTPPGVLNALKVQIDLIKFKNDVLDIAEGSSGESTSKEEVDSPPRTLDVEAQTAFVSFQLDSDSHSNGTTGPCETCEEYEDDGGEAFAELDAEYDELEGVEDESEDLTEEERTSCNRNITSNSSNSNTMQSISNIRSAECFDMSTSVTSFQCSGIIQVSEEAIRSMVSKNSLCAVSSNGVTTTEEACPDEKRHDDANVLIPPLVLEEISDRDSLENRSTNTVGPSTSSEPAIEECIEECIKRCPVMDDEAPTWLEVQDHLVRIELPTPRTLAVPPKRKCDWPSQIPPLELPESSELSNSPQKSSAISGSGPEKDTPEIEQGSPNNEEDSPQLSCKFSEDMCMLLAPRGSSFLRKSRSESCLARISLSVGINTTTVDVPSISTESSRCCSMSPLSHVTSIRTPRSSLPSLSSSLSIEQGGEEDIVVVERSVPAIDFNAITVVPREDSHNVCGVVNDEELSFLENVQPIEMQEKPASSTKLHYPLSCKSSQDSKVKSPLLSGLRNAIVRWFTTPAVEHANSDVDLIEKELQTRQKRTRPTVDEDLTYFSSERLIKRVNYSDYLLENEDRPSSNTVDEVIDSMKSCLFGSNAIERRLSQRKSPPVHRAEGVPIMVAQKKGGEGDAADTKMPCQVGGELYTVQNFREFYWRQTTNNTVISDWRTACPHCQYLSSKVSYSSIVTAGVSVAKPLMEDARMYCKDAQRSNAQLSRLCKRGAGLIKDRDSFPKRPDTEELINQRREQIVAFNFYDVAAEIAKAPNVKACWEEEEVDFRMQRHTRSPDSHSINARRTKKYVCCTFRFWNRILFNKK